MENNPAAGLGLGLVHVFTFVNLEKSVCVCCYLVDKRCCFLTWRPSQTVIFLVDIFLYITSQSGLGLWLLASLGVNPIPPLTLNHNPES